MSVSSFAEDLWRNFGRPYPVRSYITYGDGVLLATASGIRYLTPDLDVLFSTVTGLETSSFYALTLCKEGIFAVSEYGLIAGWDIETANWNVINRSFVSNGVRLIQDMAVGYKKFLVLAFEDRLAFFDVLAKRSVLTINKVGKNSLLATPVQALSVHNDTLYVSVEKTLYKRYIDWEHMEKEINLVDPETWSVERKGEEIRTIAWKGDSLKTYPVKGQWEWDKKGRLTSSGRDSTEIMVEGTPLSDNILYDDKGVSRVYWVGLSNTYAFLVGEYFVVGYDTKKKSFIDYSEISNFTLDGSYEVRPKAGGGVIAASLEGRISHTVDNVWQYRAFADEGHANDVSALSNRMKVLAFLPPDIVFYHLWGSGFYLYSKFGHELIKSTATDKNRCYNEIDNRPENKNFVVTAGTTVAPDSSGFLTTASTTGGFDLIYVTKDGEFSCYNHAGTNDFTGPISAVATDSGWIVMVAGRQAASFEAEGEVEVFLIADPAKRGGRIDVLSHKTIPSAFKDSPVDMAYDEKGDYLWLVTKDQIGYWDAGNTDKDTIRPPHVMKGVIGSEYTSLEFDVLGNLWVGTTSQGVYRLTRKGVTQDTLTAKHFTAKTGLLSDEVLDIAIDAARGEAWFSHARGLTMYKRGDLRDVSVSKKDSTKHDLIAYPNPFRLGEHSHITIDNVGANAVVSIYNRAGHLIRSFNENETKGGSVDWDGVSKRGNVAAPGVYWYVVKSSSGKNKKGKFILIH